MAVEKKRWTPGPDDAGRRADQALVEAFPGRSRADFHRAFAAGLVAAGGRPIAKSYRLRAGEEIAFSLAPEPDRLPAAVDLGLRLLWEDADLAAVDKPAGLVTHPGAGAAGEPTLVHGLLHCCGGRLSALAGEDRPGIVHRLDRETSGVLVAAKTDRGYRAMTDLFKRRGLIKEYLALVAGEPDLDSGRIERPVERHPTRRTKMRVAGEGAGRAARTDWEVERRLGGFALLRCRIHTGRTHQIRVHLQWAGMPILGDATYGFRHSSQLPMRPPRVMLHSERLAFVHPLTRESLDIRAPRPEDFRAFLGV